MTDEHSSSDVNLEKNIDAPINQHKTNICKVEIKPHQYKKKSTDGSIDSIISISGDRSVLRSNDVIFHHSNTGVDQLAEKIEHFTYVPETDEILFKLRGQLKIYRRPIAKKGRLHFLMSFDCDSVVSMSHGATAYLVVILKHVWKGNDKTYTTWYSICSINDTGCHVKPAQSVSSLDTGKSRIKIHKSSFVIMDINKIWVTKVLTFDWLFSYTDSVGNRPE